MTGTARWLLLATLVHIASVSCAQQPASATESRAIDAGQKAPGLARREPSLEVPTETIHTRTQLVIVDVVVEDKNGHPVHGLTRDNFILSDEKKPQTIRIFEEHSAASDKKPNLPKPRLPRGVFTNYSAVAPNGTLNVLLVDSLNTPMVDQAYLRQQLLDFIKHEPPGTNVAIFGLVDRLFMLQGFTTDPETLRDAVDHFNAKGSPLLNDEVTGGPGPEKLSEFLQSAPDAAANAQMISNLAQWEAEQASFQTTLRSNYTLDAFNSLAHYLANFPGRKNLIWFSGSFPLQVQPDPTVHNPFAVMEDSNLELRETTNMLAAAQIAVYPVDARGLKTESLFDITQGVNRMSSVSRNPSSSTDDSLKFAQTQADEHMTMEAMAADTGGHAFYNTNGLSAAVSEAIDAGSNYYTLTYSPSERKWNTAWRNLHVELTGTSAQGMKLTYRRGYYADDPKEPPAPKRAELHTRPTPTSSAGLADHAAEVYSRTAISHGAPAPEDIVFKVRVVPLTGKIVDTLALDNQANPRGKMKAPYRTFAVDYAALPRSFSMTPQSDGRHKGAIEFGIFVYDAKGNLLNISDKQVSLNLPPDTYKEFQSDAVRLQLQVSAPVKQESFLRLIIRDIPTNRYGVVEIPTAQVKNLPPLEAQNVPANGAAAPNGAPAPQPAGKQ